MYAVIIKNEQKGPFETLEEANAWLEQNIALGSFGKNDRWKLEEQFTGSESLETKTDERIIVDFPEVLEHTEMQMQYDYTDPMNPVELGEVEVTVPFRAEENHTEYFFPVEYTYVITDITAEHEAKEALTASVSLGTKLIARCDKAFNYIVGYNVANLASEEIDALEITFADAMPYLTTAKRPDKAAAIILAASLTGTGYTEAERTVILAILNGTA